jgi:hypothetical protein
MNKIAVKLEENLPIIAQEIISQNNNLTPEARTNFLENPDAIIEHYPKWHQWGIVTHSLNFGKFYDHTVSQYLDAWGISADVDSYLNSRIDGRTKGELLRISMPLHDLGKFDKKQDLESGKFDFHGHETRSREIILENLVNTRLENEGLTQSQIQYVADCAGYHFELGFVRRAAKKTQMGYTIAYTQSDSCKRDLHSKLPDYKGFEVEIGLLYLSDSLAKTDVTLDVITDEGIESSKSIVEQELIVRNLNPKLIKAVLQSPVNVMLSKTYMGELGYRN